MKRIMVTFLGIIPYNNATYYFSDDEKYQSCFGQIAFLKHLQKKNIAIDKLYCFVTKEVIAADKMTPDQMDYQTAKDKKIRPNNYLYLQDEIAKQNLNVPLAKVIYKESDEGITFFDKLENSVFKDYADRNEEIELYIDTTNAFRSIPLSMLSVLNLVDVVYKNVTVKSVFYWMTMSYKNIEFTFSDITFVNRDNRIAAELERFEQTFMISDLNEKYLSKEEKSKRLTKLFEDLKGINRSLQYVNLTDLIMYVQEAHKKLKLICTEDNGSFLNRYLILKPYLIRMNEEYDQITSECSEDDLEIAIRIAEKLYENEQIQVSVTLLEAVYNEILKKLLAENGVPVYGKNSGVVYESIQQLDAVLGLKIQKDPKVLAKARQSTLADSAHIKSSRMSESEYTEYFKNVFETADRIAPQIREKLSCIENLKAIPDFANNVRNKINHGNLSLGKSVKKRKQEIGKFITNYIAAVREINRILFPSPVKKDSDTEGSGQL